MLCPFLTDAQVEELDRFGMIELTDEIMQDMLAWAGCEQMQQDDAQSASWSATILSVQTNPPMATTKTTKTTNPQLKTTTVKRQVLDEVDAQGNIIGRQTVVFWEVIKN